MVIFQSSKYVQFPDLDEDPNAAPFVPPDVYTTLSSAERKEADWDITCAQVTLKYLNLSNSSRGEWHRTPHIQVLRQLTNAVDRCWSTNYLVVRAQLCLLEATWPSHIPCPIPPGIRDAAPYILEEEDMHRTFKEAREKLCDELDVGPDGEA